MKRRVSNTITLLDEVEQALGLEIFANVGPALYGSVMPQAARPSGHTARRLLGTTGTAKVVVR